MVVIEKNSGIFSGILSIILGLALVLLSIFAFDVLKTILFVSIGILLIIINGILILLTIIDRSNKYFWFNLILEIAGVILGIIFLNNDNTAVIIIVGIYLILFPIIRIIFAEDKKETFINELPSFIIGLLLITFSFALDEILKIITIIIGGIILSYGIFSIIATIKLNNTKKKLEEEYNNTKSYESPKKDDAIDIDVKEL